MPPEPKPFWNWKPALENATQVWKDDLKHMLLNAKSRFGDVSWKVMEDESREQYREVWGHKAMIYARASPGFHLRHFSKKAEGLPRTEQGSLVESRSEDNNTTSHCYATPFRYTIFIQELLDIYTGQGSQGDFETLRPNDYKRGQDLRVNQLREDLVSMWCNQLYSDVRIAVSGDDIAPSNADGEIYTASKTTPIYYAHSFILTSRSSYFCSILHTIKRNAQLVGEGSPPDITLPSPLFNQTSFKWIITYLYTGALPLPFPDTTPNFNTTFDIWRGAEFLGIKILPDLMAGQIITMMHGLCFPDLDNIEYAKRVGNLWRKTVASGGCQCATCQLRLPIVFQFVSTSCKETNLWRGTVRGLIKCFGLGWCTKQFAALPPILKDYLTAQLRQFLMEPVNVLPILFVVQGALDRINTWPNPRMPPWLESGNSILVQTRDYIDIILCGSTSKCFECFEWQEMVINDALGYHFGVQEKLEMIGSLIKRGVRLTGTVEVFKAIDTYSGTAKEGYFNQITPLERYLRLLKDDIRNAMASQVIHLGSPLEYTSHSRCTRTSSLGTLGSIANRFRTSYHSAFSTFNHAMSVLVAQIDELARNPSIDAYDLASLSNYSQASSRTQSTDYGFFYIRRAYSEESICSLFFSGRGMRWRSMVSLGDETEDVAQSMSDIDDR